MAQGNFEACATVTLGYEGGFTNDRRDPGNWTGGKVGVGVLKGTNMGIAANTYPNLDIKSLTKADVLPLYRARYWNGINGDALPFGVDLAVYDFGVNSGPSRGVKALQSAVGAKADGVAGAETITKAAAADGKKVIQTICASRLSFMRGLSTWNAFKRGWSSRVANVEAKAVVMWLTRGKGATAESKAALLDEASLAGSKADQQKKTAVTAGGSSGSVAATAAVTDINWWIVGGIVAVVAIAAVALYVKSCQNSERARAYQEAAAA